MFVLRRAEERGHFDFGWLDTYHTFSFGDYHDREHMGFRTLRVINEDWVQPVGGFPTHPHRDMEILTWILEGALEHKDSMGHGSVIRPGDAQRMSAGTGIYHSEFNPSKDTPVHLLQIWILPEAKGLVPEYEQKHFSDEERRGRLRLIASHDGVDGSVRLHQDVSVYDGLLSPGNRVAHSFGPERHGWLHVASGRVSCGGQTLEAGDGMAISDERAFELEAQDRSEVLLFDLG